MKRILAAAFVSLGIASIGSMSFSTSATAASFDCTKASTLVEKAICGDQNLSDYDEHLARLYKQALANAPNSDRVKADQRSWLAKRNQCKTPECLLDLYSERSSQLAQILDGVPVGKGFTGTYKNKYGQILVRQTSDLMIEFSLNVVSPQQNMGSAAGEAIVLQNAAAYSDEEYPCTLLFVFGDDRLELRQWQTCGFGVGVVADGDYKLINRSPEAFSIDD